MSARRLFVDIETIPRPDAAEYIKAKRNLKDEAKIAADIAAKAEMAAVDVDLALPVCIGLWHPDPQELTPASFWTEHVDHIRSIPEADILRMIWDYLQHDKDMVIAGFNLDFDVLLLLRRSQLLGVKPVNVDTNRYRPYRCDDLMQRLTFKGALPWKPLSTYAKLFGVEVDDDMSGADVPAAIAAGEFDRVERHCLSDVRICRDLFTRLETFQGAFQAAQGQAKE